MSDCYGLQARSRYQCLSVPKPNHAIVAREKNEFPPKLRISHYSMFFNGFLPFFLSPVAYQKIRSFLEECVFLFTCVCISLIFSSSKPLIFIHPIYVVWKLSSCHWTHQQALLRYPETRPYRCLRHPLPPLLGYWINFSSYFRTNYFILYIIWLYYIIFDLFFLPAFGRELQRWGNNPQRSRFIQHLNLFSPNAYNNFAAIHVVCESSFLNFLKCYCAFGIKWINVLLTYLPRLLCSYFGIFSLVSCQRGGIMGSCQKFVADRICWSMKLCGFLLCLTKDARGQLPWEGGGGWSKKYRFPQLNICPRVDALP